jgi:hypothetical protein
MLTLEQIEQLKKLAAESQNSEIIALIKIFVDEAELLNESIMGFQPSLDSAP